MATEYNFDGLVGPTHNYGGLGVGNLASAESRGETSHPRRAALQGIEKMRLLHRLGVPQAVLPPQLRPDLELARRLGFDGDDAAVLARLAAEAPRTLAICSSAASMWAANAATVCPSADSADGRVHITPANLRSQLHRAIEAETTTRILRAVFADERYFRVHDPLPASLGDEGAANHARFAPEPGARGVHLFVYGASADPSEPRPTRFAARQSKEACEALARRHRLAPEQVVFAQQSPELVDAGVFHNDVVSVGHGGLFLAHERAFADPSRVLDELSEKYSTVTGDTLALVRVSEAVLPVTDAVSSYLFNSQLVTRPNGRVAMIAPEGCASNPRTRDLIAGLVASGGPVQEVHYVDLRESMRGGGGPACLRLRIVLTDEEADLITPGVRFDEALDSKLVAWVQRHYRDALSPDDLADPALLEEGRAALAELNELLGLPA